MHYKTPLEIRTYTELDVPEMAEIWNDVVRAGNAFPQLEELDLTAAQAFFSQQSECRVALDQQGNCIGFYILHPNNIGRCGHIGNASYAVASRWRGHGIGEALVRDCIIRARLFGFRLLQFNAVVHSNTIAQKLYEKIGFVRLGSIPGGFLMPDGHYEDIVLYYLVL